MSFGIGTGGDIGVFNVEILLKGDKLALGEVDCVESSS